MSSIVNPPDLSGLQPLDADLTSLAALSGTGIAVRTAASAWALRSLVAPAAGIAISNADGVAGNPTLALANDLAALEGLGSTGFAARTAADTWAQRVLTSANSILTIGNPAGIAGDPLLTIVQSAITHGLIGGLSADDHAQYALRAGRTAATNDLIVSTDGDGTITGSLGAGKRLILLAGSLNSLSAGQAGIEVYPTIGSLDGVDVATMNVAGTVTVNNLLTAYNGITVGLHRTWLVSADPLSAGAYGTRAFVAAPNINSSGNRSDIGYHSSFLATGSLGAAAGEVVSSGVDIAFHDLKAIGLGNSIGTTTIAAHTSIWSQPAVFTGATLQVRTGLLYANRGGAGTVGTSIAVDVATQTVSTLAVALRSAITDASTRYFLQDSGGARSFIKGQVRFGDINDPTAQIDVVGKLLITSAGLITTYNNVAVVGFGVPAIVDVRQLTGKTADIADTAFTNAGTAGEYVVGVYLVDTTGAVGAGAVTCNIKFNDGATAQTVTIGPVGLVTLGTFAQGSVQIHLGSGSITYGTTHTGIFSTSQYALYTTCRRLK